VRTVNQGHDPVLLAKLNERLDREEHTTGRNVVFTIVRMN
jgi:hypothetical protein